MKKAVWYFLVILFGISIAYGGENMKIKSTAFEDGGKIPTKYVMPGAGGQNLSPPLQWSDEPKGTKSFALLCHDPHPIARNWVHWMVINIPSDVHSLPEGASGKSMPQGAEELTNSFGFKGYGGPQPPPGTGNHPYVFTIYALDVDKISVPERLTIEKFESILKPHILAKATLTGYFGR